MTDQPYKGKVVAITGFAPETLDLSAFPGKQNILKNKFKSLYFAHMSS